MSLGLYSNLLPSINMPVPTPNKGESQNDFISRCISNLKRIDTKRPDKQIAAICYSAWRKENFVGDDMENDENEDDYETEDTENFIKIKVCEFRTPESGVIEKITEYCFDKNKFTKEAAKRWIKKGD